MCKVKYSTFRVGITIYRQTFSSQHSPSVSIISRSHAQHPTKFVVARSVRTFGENVGSIEFGRNMLWQNDLFSCLVFDPVICVVDVFAAIGDLVRRIDGTECGIVVHEESCTKLLDKTQFQVKFALLYNFATSVDTCEVLCLVS